MNVIFIFHFSLILKYKLFHFWFDFVRVLSTDAFVMLFHTDFFEGRIFRNTPPFETLRVMRRRRKFQFGLRRFTSSSFPVHVHNGELVIVILLDLSLCICVKIVNIVPSTPYLNYGNVDFS